MRERNIPIANPIIEGEEKDAVLSVLDSGHIAQGERVREFEQRFANLCGCKHAVATTSGTTALHLAMLAHGIGEGDEVITTPFTFISTVNAIHYVGATPVFVDIDPVTFNIDASRIEDSITGKTRAILPVHLYGRLADMREIMSVARRHGLDVIEDACQAHGAYGEDSGRRAGSFGTGAFSFYATKNMTTGEGGMLTTSDDKVAALARLYRAHGSAGGYKHIALGYNFLMTDIQAAIGIVQLGKLPQLNGRRSINARRYNIWLRSVRQLACPVRRAGDVFHQYTIRVLDGIRDELLSYLNERGIGARVYYPVPVHRQPLYARPFETMYRANRALAAADKAAETVLSLPVHPLVSSDDIEFICDTIKEFYGE